MTELEICWLAGFLEGEGCFLLSKRQYPTLTASSTDLDVLLRVATLIDSLPPRHHRVPDLGHKQAWRLQLGGVRALIIMEMILPHMGERRSQRIREIIANARPAPIRPRKRRQGMAVPVLFSD